MPNRKQHPVGMGMKTSSTELGKFLQARRLILQLSQVKVCKQLGVPQGVYSLLEIGKTRFFKKEQLEDLSKILKCSLQELEGRLPKAKSPETEFGKFIRARREELGLSLLTFSERLGVSEKKAESIELKKSANSPFKCLLLLAKALDLEISALLKFVGRGKAESVLGQLIRARRIELNLSARDLANKIGVTHQAVNSVELGKTSLRRDKMIKSFADVLGLDVELLKLARRQGNPRTISKARETLLGKFLTNKRSAMDLTQGEVAELSGIAVSDVCSFELGYRQPNSEVLSRICKTLKCEIPTKDTLEGDMD